MTFNPQPKPKRSDRIKFKGKRQNKLISHRKRQYILAKSRDDGWCVFCYFLKGSAPLLSMCTTFMAVAKMPKIGENNIL